MHKEEFIDLLKAFFAISLAFTILLYGFGKDFWKVFALSALTVGTAFLFHEFAHRTVAKYYGLHAEFKAFNLGLIIAILMSFIGFIFAAPGAVMIRGHARKDQIGKIAVAGPLTNIILAVISFPLLFLFSESIIGILAGYSFFINSILAFFNMLPFAMLDGAKVLYWNRKVFGLVITTACVLFLLQYLL